MHAGYAALAVDFDSILELKISGDPTAAAAGYAIEGADLNTRYAPASVGTPAGNLGYAQAGIDIGPRFAAKNSRRLPIDGANFNTGDAALTNDSETFAGLQLNLGSNGVYQVLQQRSNTPGSIAASGTWNVQGGASSGYEVLFTVTHISGNTVAAVSGAGGWFNLGSGRSCGHTLGPYPGNMASEHDSRDRFRFQIRRVADGVIVVDATFHSEISTAGYV